MLVKGKRGRGQRRAQKLGPRFEKIGERGIQIFGMEAIKALTAVLPSMTSCTTAKPGTPSELVERVISVMDDIDK